MTVDAPSETFLPRARDERSPRPCVDAPDQSGDTIIDFAKLAQLAVERSDAYRTAPPFAHTVIDDFLPSESYAKIVDALPSLDDEHIAWGNLNANLEDGRPAQLYKHHLSNVMAMKPVLRQFFFELNSPPFLGFLERLTGIVPLLADPQMKGGGVHLTAPGGVLRVHADFMKHPSYKTDRRINLLLYANPDWKEEWGGHLELWDADMKECVKQLLPIANRCAIFNTTATSFHGHPHPLACPDGMFRTSLAAYYYTIGRTDIEIDPADPGDRTLWQDLPSEADRASTPPERD